MGLIKQREITKREQLAVERQLFEQRSCLRKVKQNLPEQYKDGDEDLLINQKVRTVELENCDNLFSDSIKPQKKKPSDIAAQRPSGAQLRLPSRQENRSAEADLVLLSDLLAEQENLIQQKIDSKISQHQKWNEGYVDLTRAPLTPPLEENIRSSFRTAMTQYLPTPPASTSSERSGELAAEPQSPIHGKDNSVAVCYASPSYDGPCQSQPSFRRRYGRGGRLMIDRRGMRVHSTEGLDDVIVDRFKFDNDDDDDEVPVYLVDPYDISTMRYRAKISGSYQNQFQSQVSRRQPIESTPSNPQENIPNSNSASLSNQPRPD